MATLAHAARHHGVRNQGECDVRLLLHCDALAPQGERLHIRHARASTGIGMGKTPRVVRCGGETPNTTT